MNPERRQYSLPYGKGELDFALPPAMKPSLLTSAALPPLPNPTAAIREALAKPTGAPPLRELARSGQRVCLVVTDVTRHCPDRLLVPPLLGELERAGVSRQDITILIGLGMHRPSREEERREMLGRRVLARYRVIDHAPSQPGQVVFLGRSRLGVPLWVNRIVAEAELVLATGLVEPHPHAGFSGGGKTVAIGAGGEETISVTHSPAMLDRPGVRVGNYRGNPFQETVQEAAERAGLRFILNVVLDDRKQMVAVKAGEPRAAHQALVQTAEQLYLVPVEGPFDVVIGGVGHPKDANLYQATRVAINMVFAPRPVVREGGVVIIPAPAAEGAGQGVGEERFLAMLSQAESLDAVIAQAKERGCRAGEQAAYLMAHTLKQARVIIVGAEGPETVRQLKMTTVKTMEEAVKVAQQLVGPQATVAVLPRGLLTLPLVRQDEP